MKWSVEQRRAMPASLFITRSLATVNRSHCDVAGLRCFTTYIRTQDTQSHLPRVAQPALWRGMIPKVFRKEQAEAGEGSNVQGTASERSPGLPLIILGLLAGSFAINIISLRREMTNFSRKTETKLDLLREVVGKVRRGEDVDVKRLLGTGDPTSEQEWEEVIRELETTDMLAAIREKKAARRASREEQRKGEQESRKAHPSTDQQKSLDSNTGKDRSGPKFMM